MTATRGVTTAVGQRAAARSSRRAELWQRVVRERWMLLFILPGFLYFVVFRYVPLLGNIIAFQDYSPFLGFRDSPFVGLQNFRKLFTDPDVGIAIRNTLIISFLQLVLFFPAPIALALMLNSMVSERLKRLMQSVVYLPHFLSWVIIIALWQQIVGGAGVVNQLLRENGLGTVDIMSNPAFFKPLTVLQLMWKDTGWGTIIFLAALTKIDLALYEAAVMDGASGWRRLWHITLPGIRSVIFLLLILRLGRILDTGFEQIFLQRGAVGANAAEVLDTFTYFRGIQGGDWGFSTAVGLVKGLVGAVMVFGSNWLVKRFGEEGAF